MLALLLCTPGQVVLVDHMIWSLWGENVPHTPSGLVRNYIMKLRRTLNGAAPIITRGAGYQLEIDPLAVDVVRFERDLKRAREIADPPTAGQMLDTALRYWHGPALADARQGFVLECEAERLDNLRTEARQLRAELLLESASFGEAVSELQSLVAANPHWERLHELSMVALARDGRAAEALDAYARFREYHRDEFGLDPSDRLVKLQQVILRGEAAGWQISTRRQLNGK